MDAEAFETLDAGFKTERLRIRAPRLEDAPDLNRAKLESFKELREWFPWAQKRPTPEESEEEMRRVREEFLKREDFRLHLFSKESGEFVGSSGLHRPNWEIPAFEIGYWIRNSFTGLGYATEAVCAIAGFAISEFGARRVEIRCDDRNERSARVAEKAGFTFEGKLRNNEPAVDGSLRDTLVFSLLP